jgi:hypothetical protein
VNTVGGAGIAFGDDDVAAQRDRGRRIVVEDGGGRGVGTERRELRVRDLQ